MFYLNKLKNRTKTLIHKLVFQDYMGGERIKKSLNFWKFKFNYTRLPKCEKICETFYENTKVYLSITAILYNEAPYVKEWIEYHRMLGVERFYIYDNGSDDNVKEILKPYIDEGLVCYHYFPGFEMQNKAYRDAIFKYKNQTRWMAFIDLDEFIFPVENNSISEFLKNYEKHPAVVINWQVFDSNGFEVPPAANGGLITANYFRTYADDNTPINRHVKSIVNPKKVRSINNPHFCYYKNFACAVDENFKKVEGPFTEVNTSNKIKIKHYHCKSREEYMVKVNKWCADVKRKRPFTEETLNILDSKFDYGMQKFLPELKRRLEIK